MCSSLILYLQECFGSIKDATTGRSLIPLMVHRSAIFHLSLSGLDSFFAGKKCWIFFQSLTTILSLDSIYFVRSAQMRHFNLVNLNAYLWIYVVTWSTEQVCWGCWSLFRDFQLCCYCAAEAWKIITLKAYFVLSSNASKISSSIALQCIAISCLELNGNHNGE
jgi:uncharacterized membrane protein YfhO